MTNVFAINPTAPRQISEGEANQFELTSYVLMIRTNACTSCSAIHNFSELHEVWTHPTKTALNNAKILKGAKTLQPGFPIATVETPVQNVPLCQECYTTIDTGAARAFPPVSYTAWADTLQRKAQDLIEVRREAAARTNKPTPTLDQL